MSVTSRTIIDAPTDQVWNALADIGSIYKWNPGVSHSYTTSDQTRGDETTRHCDLDEKNYLKERVFDWREGESFKIDVFESSLPMKSNIVTFSVEPADSQTTVSVNADYKLKFGPLGALMDTLFARRQVQQGFDDMMKGLKHFVETGEEVGDSVPEALATSA